jgi:hypothetical protein
MEKPTVYEEGDRILDSIISVNCVCKSDTAVDIKCGGKVVFAERENLIAVSDFFESMLALKPTREEAVIDLTSFCSDEMTLISLIQFANLRDIVPFQWSISTIANMIFLVDPLQLTKLVENELYKHLSAIIANPNALGEFVIEVGRVVTNRQPEDAEIENVLAMLKEMNSEAILRPPRWEAEAGTIPVIYRDLITGLRTYEQPKEFKTQCFDSEEKIPSLVILAVWMRTMSETLVFARLADVLDKVDVKIGNVIPEKLEDSCALDPKLASWIRMIYAY